VQLIAKSQATPLYSCMKMRIPLFGSASMVPVLGVGTVLASRLLTRLSIDALLES
jgi:hypothetical protein